MKVKISIISKQRIAGFTVTELMVLAALVAILSMLAVPNYLTYLANNRAKNLAFLINGAISMAKNEAVHRGLSVELCGISTEGGALCNHTASNWQFGWLIAILPLNNVARTYLPSNASAVTVEPASSIVFSPSGFPTPQIFTITIKPNGCSQGYQITYNATGATGRLTTQPVACP